MLNFRDYIELNERKQVGMVYHFTNLNALIMMIEGGFKGMRSNATKNTFSMTRNPDLTHKNKFEENYVRIKIDGTKLSDNVKIKPVLGLNVYGTDYKELLDVNSKIDRVEYKGHPKDKEEWEEVVIGSPVDISKSIVNIEILRRFINDPYIDQRYPYNIQGKELEDLLVGLSSKIGYNIKVVNKFSRR